MFSSTFIPYTKKPPPLWIFLYPRPALTTDHSVICKQHSPWRLLSNPACLSIRQQLYSSVFVTTNHILLLPENHHFSSCPSNIFSLSKALVNILVKTQQPTATSAPPQVYLSDKLPFCPLPSSMLSVEFHDELLSHRQSEVTSIPPF